MPYVSEPRRDLLRCLHRRVDPTTSGELNFVLTECVTTYLNEVGITYSTINDVVGALEGAKLEFYRRVAVPYENRKCAENGDVY